MLKLLLIIGLILFQSVPGVSAVGWDFEENTAYEENNATTSNAVVAQTTEGSNVALAQEGELPWDFDPTKIKDATATGEQGTLPWDANVTGNLLIQGENQNVAWDFNDETKSSWDFDENRDPNDPEIMGDGNEMPWDFEIKDVMPWDFETTGAVSDTTTTLSVISLVSTSSNVFAESIFVKPGDLVSFQIKITALGGSLSDVILKDILPNGIIYLGNIRVDGSSAGGDIATGINIGSLSVGKSKIVVFDAKIADKEKFSFGQTKLVNSVFVSKGSLVSTDTNEINVFREGVAGAATQIPTGLTDNVFLDSFFFPLLLAFLAIWLFKSRIISLEKWIDERKREFKEYRNSKLLQARIAKIRIKEFFDKRS